MSIIVGISERGEGYFGRNPQFRLDSEKMYELMGREDIELCSSNLGALMGFSKYGSVFKTYSNKTKLAVVIPRQIRTCNLRLWRPVL